MTAMIMIRPDAELCRRLRPSREQLRVAAAMFRASTEDVTSIVVPVVAAYPIDRSIEPAGRTPRPGAERLEHPGGYWLADRASRDGEHGYLAAHDAAEAAARAHLDRDGTPGVAGWVAIRPDGTWTAFAGDAAA
jgi:hypothetical protein